MRCSPGKEACSFLLLLPTLYSNRTLLLRNAFKLAASVKVVTLLAADRRCFQADVTLREVLSDHNKNKRTTARYDDRSETQRGSPRCNLSTQAGYRPA